mgnify:CR=1 FL=1|jgi:NADH-quinone oxidoreductase subunit L
MLKALVLIPLASAGIIGIFGRRWSERLIAVMGCGSVGLSMLLAIRLFFVELWARPPEHRLILEPFFSWIESGPLRVAWGFQLDALSGVYILFVTFVGFWIHVFAVGYMRGDPGYARFFAYMNLFMFMMLVLVLADNFLVMFIGWEGVGLCSYLLIGHDFDRAYAARAAKKAFIVNRIGDFGFALGMILIFATFGTLRFPEVMGAVAARFPEPEALGEVGIVTAIALLLFVGATGKSAQIPLYVWLPDAMAGPTPVSALIHAATMVTAGVYMIARCSELYARSLTALFVIAVVGALTAFLAATIGLAQWNIKKVLAYSTISQLGYMFLACGVGAFSAAIFHVVTHAFFKAVLFLGAGSVIIALHHEEDMRRMGGLRRYLPLTYGAVLCGWLAIAGLPPFSGFFSKDEILWRTWTSPVLPEPWGRVLWGGGFVTAILTATYMTRWIVLTFEGHERFAHPPEGHGGVAAPRESPRVMTIPLLVLAALSIGGGWVGISEAYTGGHVANWFEQFIRPALARAPVHPHRLAVVVDEPSHGWELGLAAVTALAVLVALLWARRFYQRDPLRPAPSLLENGYYVDEIYEALFVRPLVRGSTVLLWRFFDVTIIDGVVNGVAAFVAACAAVLRRLQTGLVRSYVVMFVIGALLVLGYFIFIGGRIPAR